MTFKLSYKLKKTKIRIEKPKVTLSVALVIPFLEAESENRQLEDLQQADSGRVSERFPLSVRTKSITENFVYGKLRPLFVFIVFQRIFSSWALAPTHFTIITRGLSILLFSFITKLTFPVSKGLLCLYDKKDMEFLFSCSTPHLTRSLRSLVSYRVKHSKRNSISTLAHLLFSIYRLKWDIFDRFAHIM